MNARLACALACLILGLASCGGGGGGTTTPTPALPSVSFTASPSSVNSGETSTLSWTSSNATSVAINPPVSDTALELSGSAVVTPSATTTYTLTASNTGGSASATATVTVGSASAVPRSAIKHVIVLMMQNSSFDHLFGTYPGANGLDPAAASYNQVDQAGNTVHPELLTDFAPPDLNHDATSYSIAWNGGAMDKYALQNGDLAMKYYDNTSQSISRDGVTYGVDTLWSYASQYALADNFFASAMSSEPANVLYMTAASVGTGSDAYGYPQLDACSQGLFDNNPDPTATITPPLTFQNIGDQLSSAAISWAWYHENFITEQNGVCDDYVPQENPFQYFSTTANSANVQNFTLDGFNSLLASASLPAVTWLQPAPENSMHPGAGDIANGIAWMDSVVKAVQGSSSWADSAIFVVWDESGGWYDHVPPPQLSGAIGLGARVPVLVISPFARTNYISHQQMDWVSLLRFIQWNWALGQFADPAQSAREQQSADICDLLTTSCAAP